MGNWVVCPRRDSSKVALAVCLVKCEHKHECEELMEVPTSDIEAVARKLNLNIEVDVVLNESPIEVAEDSLLKPAASKPKDQKTNLPAVKNGAADSSAPTEEQRVKRAADLMEEAVILRSDVEVRFLSMGRVLDEIYKNKYYLDLGYEDWKRFCAEALDIKWRWALYVRAVYLKKEELGLSDHDCARVGIRKLAELLPVMTDKQTAQRWIEEAKKPGMTAEKLIAKVRHARGRINKEEAEKTPHKLIYSVYEDQLETIERAHELAREVTQSDSRAVQLEAMAEEFRATYEHESGDFKKARIVSGVIRRLESIMKVKVNEVVDVETGEILT